MMMKRLMLAALAAMATFGYGCGSGRPSGSGGAEGTECVGNTCATIQITLTRLPARVCVDSMTAEWSYCKSYDPGIWDIRVPAPDTYAVSAQYSDGEFVGEEVPVTPGGTFRVDCTHPDDRPQEKKMVRIDARGSVPGAVLMVDGVATGITVGGSYEMTLDGETHEATLVDPTAGYVHTVEEVDTASTVPDALMFTGLVNVAGNICTETRGPQPGWVSSPLEIAQVGHDLHVRGLDAVTDFAAVGTSIDTMVGDYHVVGSVSTTDIQYEIFDLVGVSQGGPKEYTCR